MNLFNDDFKDFILALNKYNVAYIMVGGYAVIFRGYSRTTGDIDIWVEKTSENYKRLKNAIVEFGLPDAAIPEANFLSSEFDVFTFGRPPFAIDVMTEVKGLEFIPTYQLSTIEQVNNIPVRIIHLNQLITAKKAAGRHKDLNDLENLPSK